MPKILLAPPFLALVFLGSCRSGAAPAGPASAGAPAASHFANLGDFRRTVSTRSSEAQRWFDQGLVLYYGFNHAEAARAFAEAERLDPSLAMAPWGIALSAGPNINNATMDDARNREAFAAAARARSRLAGATPVERALVGALAARYADPPPADRAALDRAYADAMREAYRAHPGDLDVAALFAESLMDLRPWDLWSSAGEPRPETPEILDVIEKGLAANPRHPGLNHFAIHSWEASPTPGRALPAADRLRDLVPDAGHLVHMPSHIDIRVGHYAEAAKANERAIESDRRYLARAGDEARGGVYAMYRAHDYHFLVYASMFEGRREVALRAAREMLEQIPPEVIDSMPEVLESFVPTPLHAMVRFGMWEEILREPLPPAKRLVSTAVSHYARGLALSSLGRIEEAEAERRAFDAAFAAVPASYTFGNNTAPVVLEIGRAMLEGEILVRKGESDAGFARLRDAVAKDDALKYDEPWSWMQPPRHALGALLLQEGRVEEAEAVYRADLRRHPNNGWSLHGLAECLRREKKDDEAAKVESSFAESWARADITIRASCFCRQK